MDSQKIIHIAAEVVLLGAVTFYFNSQIKSVRNEVKDLKTKIEEQQETFNKHINNLYTIIDGLNTDKKRLSEQLQLSRPLPVLRTGVSTRVVEEEDSEEEDSEDKIELPIITPNRQQNFIKQPVLPQQPNRPSKSVSFENSRGASPGRGFENSRGASPERGFQNSVAASGPERGFENSVAASGPGIVHARRSSENGSAASPLGFEEHEKRTELKDEGLRRRKHTESPIIVTEQQKNIDPEKKLDEELGEELQELEQEEQQQENCDGDTCSLPKKENPQMKLKDITDIKQSESDLKKK